MLYEPDRQGYDDRQWYPFRIPFVADTESLEDDVWESSDSDLLELLSLSFDISCTLPFLSRFLCDWHRTRHLQRTYSARETGVMQELEKQFDQNN